jgi:hypothetical protein
MGWDAVERVVEGQGAEDQAVVAVSDTQAVSSQDQDQANQSRLDLAYTLSEGCGRLRKSSKGMKFYSKRELCSLLNV